MSVEDQRVEIERILHAPQFRRAPKLQRFLQVICEHHFENRAADISEYLIATEAFGRGADFNPSEDSLVRVQAREVRRRLREFYQEEGKSSRWILDVPTGHYAPVFTAVAEPALAEPLPAEPAPPSVRSAQRWAPSLRAVWWTLAGMILLCTALLIAAEKERRLLVRTTTLAGAHGSAVLTRGVANLWGRFVDSDVPTLLVVSNPDVGECGDRKVGTAGCADEYTGMGEAVAIHLITSLFQSSKQSLIVKQSRIVTADDVKRYNLVLLGGKSVNIWTRRLGEGLSLADPEALPRYQTVVDSQTGQITRDRGLFALRRHPSTGRWVLFIWGHHSQGTHAAAEASTDERFLSQLKWPAAAFPESFHVLVSVDVNDALPERPLPVAVRVP